MNNKLIKLANEVLDHHGDVKYCDCNNILCSYCFLSMENNSDGESCSSRCDFDNYTLSQTFLKRYNKEQNNSPTLSIAIGDIVRYESPMGNGYGKVYGISEVIAHIEELEKGVIYHLSDLKDYEIYDITIKANEVKEIYKLQK